MLEFRYDTQLLIEGKNLNQNDISEYFMEHFNGDCLLAVGDDELIKIHFLYPIEGYPLAGAQFLKHLDEWLKTYLPP